MERVTVVPDARCNEIYPYQFPCVLTITLTDGTQHVAEVLANRGGPGLPLTTGELSQKFADNVEGLLSGDAAAEIVSSLSKFTALDNVGSVMSLLRQVGPASL